jgi:hypothetical protein
VHLSFAAGAVSVRVPPASTLMIPHCVQRADRAGSLNRFWKDAGVPPASRPRPNPKRNPAPCRLKGERSEFGWTPDVLPAPAGSRVWRPAPRGCLDRPTCEAQPPVWSAPVEPGNKRSALYRRYRDREGRQRSNPERTAGILPAPAGSRICSPAPHGCLDRPACDAQPPTYSARAEPGNKRSSSCEWSPQRAGRPRSRVHAPSSRVPRPSRVRPGPISATLPP